MRRRTNDSRDIDPAELKLIRVGHFIWLERKRALQSEDVEHVRALDAALQTVWELKRQRRAELKVERAERSKQLRQRFTKAKQPLPMAA